MFVLTVDQQDSRNHADQVPNFMAALKGLEPELSFVLPFDRTAGDEVQAVTAEATTVLSVAETVVRLQGWYLGIGVGGVDDPLPESSRFGRGEAFYAARQAVERAKRSDPPIVLASGDDRIAQQAADASALLRLVASVWQRRSAEGWEAVDSIRSGKFANQQAAARALGITPQAMSARLKAALWEQEAAVAPLLSRLLSELSTGEAKA